MDVVLTPIEGEAGLGLDESLVVSVKGTFEGSSLSAVRTEEISVGRSDIMFEFFAVVAVALVEELSPLRNCVVSCSLCEEEPSVASAVVAISLDGDDFTVKRCDELGASVGKE